MILGWNQSKLIHLNLTMIPNLEWLMTFDEQYLQQYFKKWGSGVKFWSREFR